MILPARNFFILLLICFAHFVNGNEIDSTYGRWNMQGRFDHGFIIAHRPALEPIQNGHVNGFEISLAKISDGSREWQNIFHFPDYGLTAAFFDLGSPEHLGKGIAVYPFVDFPLGKHGGGWHFRYGMGLGYVEKIFDPLDNFKNAALGSHVNGVIHFDLHYAKYVSRKLSFEVGSGITHFSNGSYSLPNLGINIATLNFAVSHTFGNPVARLNSPLSAINNKLQWHIYTGGFLKKIYPPRGKKYFAGTISTMMFKPLNHKSAVGLGADIFYDNSLAANIRKADMREPAEINNFRPGIYGAYHLSVNRIGLMFNMGYYVYSKYKGDGNIYHRISVRYYFEKIFLCVNLKTHYARADFLEVGAGIKIK